MHTENIIMFPKTKKNTPPQTIEDLRKNINDVRLEHIENVIMTFIPDMFAILVEQTGDNSIITGDNLTKDSALVIESIKSLLYKSIGVDYPLQKICEKLYALKESKEFVETPMVYQQYDKIDVTIKKEDK